MKRPTTSSCPPAVTTASVAVVVFQSADCVDIRLRQAVGTLDIDIVRLIVDEVGAHRIFHVGRGLCDADQKPDAQRDNRHDGDKPPETRFKFLCDVFVEFTHNALRSIRKKPLCPARTAGCGAPTALPLDGGYVCGVFLHDFRFHAAVFDVNHPLRHLRDGLVVRDDYDRLFPVAADILQQF